MAKVIQIAHASDQTSSTILFALKDDGTIWRLHSASQWEQVPQPPETPERTFTYAMPIQEPF